MRQGWIRWGFGLKYKDFNKLYANFHVYIFLFFARNIFETFFFSQNLWIHL